MLLFFSFPARISPYLALHDSLRETGPSTSLSGNSANRFVIGFYTYPGLSSPRAPEGFGIEIATHFAVQPDRGASIDEIGHLDHMLPFAFWIGGDSASIFQVELDFLLGLPQSQRLGLAPMVVCNTAGLAQDHHGRNVGSLPVPG